MLTPTVRHVATCVTGCGWRQATRLTNSYPIVCPNGCGNLDHAVIAFDRHDDLQAVRRDGHIRRGMSRRGRK